MRKGKQLGKNEIQGIRAGQSFYVVLTRLFHPKPVVVWEGPAALYTMPVEGKMHGRRGPQKLALITLLGRDWAEYDDTTLEDRPEGAALVAENYMMELFHLEEGGGAPAGADIPWYQVDLTANGMYHFPVFVRAESDVLFQKALLDWVIENRITPGLSDGTPFERQDERNWRLSLNRVGAPDGRDLTSSYASLIR